MEFNLEEYEIKVATAPNKGSYIRLKHKPCGTYTGIVKNLEEAGTKAYRHHFACPAMDSSDATA